jgi:PPOX class probable F420-dependent enzyme
MAVTFAHNGHVPRPPLPAEVDDFLRRPNPAVVATLRRDGSPHTAATWYLWDGERILLNMDESRLRLRFMRRDPRVALTALGDESWYRHVSLLGRVVSLEPDTDLSGIDRLARHYTGEPFSRRGASRVSALVEVEAWHAWEGSAPWPSAAQRG